MTRWFFITVAVILRTFTIGCSIRPRDTGSSESMPPMEKAAVKQHSVLNITSDPVAVRRFTTDPLDLTGRIHITGCVTEGPYEILYSAQSGRIHQGHEGVWFTPPDVTSDPSGQISECAIPITAICPHGDKANG